MRTPYEFERERAEAGVILPKGYKPERQNTELPLIASEQGNLLTSTIKKKQRNKIKHAKECKITQLNWKEQTVFKNFTLHRSSHLNLYRIDMLRQELL